MAPEIIRSKAGHGKVGWQGSGAGGGGKGGCEAGETQALTLAPPTGCGLVEPGHLALRAADGGLALHPGG